MFMNVLSEMDQNRAFENTLPTPKAVTEVHGHVAQDDIPVEPYQHSGNVYTLVPLNYAKEGNKLGSVFTAVTNDLLSTEWWQVHFALS
jgi:hypothetical protein